MRGIETAESPGKTEGAAVFNCCFWDLDYSGGGLMARSDKPRQAIAKQLFGVDEDAGGPYWIRFCFCSWGVPLTACLLSM